MRVRDPTDTAAWQDFDRLYREWLIRFFRRKNVPLSDAEDLSQRIFVSLATTLPQFTYDPNRGRFRDYLYRCARNALFEWARCLDKNGKGLFTDDALVLACADFDPAESQVWEEEWINHHCRRALQTLKSMATDRDIAILERSMAGATVAELASEFEMEQAAVQKVRQRIREKMEALIAAQVADEDRIDD